MIYVLSAVILYMLIAIILQNREHRRKESSLMTMVKESHAMIQQSLDKAATERQQLLDRIQAPSYDVMKHHEVKIIKAKNNEKEPEKLEVL